MQVAIVLVIGGILAAIITACATIASAMLPIVANDHGSPTNTSTTFTTLQMPLTAVTTPSITLVPSVTATYTLTATISVSLTNPLQINSVNPLTLTDIYVQTQISKMTTALAATYGIN